MSMLSPGNVATPAAAARVVVPERTPPQGLGCNVTLMLPLNVVAVFPNPSRARTSIAGEMLAPETIGVGCTVNASCVAAPATMLNGALVALSAMPMPAATRV